MVCHARGFKPKRIATNKGIKNIVNKTFNDPVAAWDHKRFIGLFMFLLQSWDKLSWWCSGWKRLNHNIDKKERPLLFQLNDLVGLFEEVKIRQQKSVSLTSKNMFGYGCQKKDRKQTKKQLTTLH